MHRSHLPLKTWFMAVHIVTSHSNGISALQLQAQLGLGSYKSAWLLLHKLRRAMVDPDRSLLEDLIEIDEATLPFRTAKRPGHRRARSQPTRQDAHCRRGRAIARGRATPHPAGADRGFLRAQPSCLRCRDLGAGRAGDYRWLERLLRPARPRPPAQGRRCNARPSRADVDPSCVLEPEALGARNLPWPAPRPSAPLPRRVRVPLEPPPPHPQRPSTPCSASARACDPPTTATSSDNTSDPGRPGASHRPPSDPPQSEPNTGPPACLTALETNFLKSKSSRTSPGTVRKPCLKRRRPINIWCDRKKRDRLN